MRHSPALVGSKPVRSRGQNGRHRRDHHGSPGAAAQRGDRVNDFPKTAPATRASCTTQTRCLMKTTTTRSRRRSARRRRRARRSTAGAAASSSPSAARSRALWGACAAGPCYRSSRRRSRGRSSVSSARRHVAAQHVLPRRKAASRVHVAHSWAHGRSLAAARRRARAEAGARSKLLAGHSCRSALAAFQKGACK